MLKIGITGNIASGKSEAQKIISSMGYKVVDLDIVSHQLLQNDKEVQQKVLDNFNTINRKELADIIFNNEDKKKILENIIHPKLNEYIENFFTANKDEKAVFVSGATIFEAGFDKTFDKIILIDAPFEFKINRLMKRNALSYDEALLRLKFQQNNITKTRYVINNDSSVEDLEKNIKKIFEMML